MSGNNGRCQVDYNQHYTTDQIQNDFNEKMQMHHMSGSKNTSDKMGYSNERNQSFTGDISDITINKQPRIIVILLSFSKLELIKKINGAS